MKSNGNSPTLKPSTEPAPAPATADAVKDDFHAIVDLLAERAEIDHATTEQEQFVKLASITAARTNAHEHTELSLRSAEIERQIEVIIRKHPEWFAERKSIPTPFGVVKLTRSTSLVVRDEEDVVIKRVARHYGRKSGDYIRTEHSLDLEAMEKLNDAQLKEFGIERVTEDNFSIQAVKSQTAAAYKSAAKNMGGGK